MPRTVTTVLITSFRRLVCSYTHFLGQSLGRQVKPQRFRFVFRRHTVGQYPSPHTIFPVYQSLYFLCDRPVRHVTSVTGRTLIEILANDSFRQATRIFETVSRLELVIDSRTRSLYDVPSVRTIGKRGLFYESFRYVNRILFRSHRITEINDVGLQVLHSFQ